MSRLTRIAAVVGVVVCLGIFFSRTDWQAKISTDVTELIPDAQGEPALELARSLLKEKSMRVVLFALEGEDAGELESAVADTRALLEESGFFSEVLVDMDSLADSPWARELYTDRLPLLFPAWFAGHAEVDALPTRVAENLRDFLTMPEYPMFRQSIGGDPLLLLPGLLQSMSGSVALPEMTADAPHRLIWARQKISPFTPEGQRPLFELVRTVQADLPDSITLSYTGVARFASQSRAGIETEIQWLTACGMGIALLITVFGVRTPRLLPHMFIPLVCGLAASLALCLVIFPSIHLLSLALASVLFGVAVDYSFHTVLHHRAQESYANTLRRVRWPLLLSMATSVSGFLFLLFSELPLLRQMGLLVACGLGFSLVFLILWMPVVQPPSGTQPGKVRTWSPSVHVLRVLLAVLFFAGVTGWLRVHWMDSLDDLQIPLPELVDNEARLYEMLGKKGETHLVLTGGGTLDDALSSTRELGRKLNLDTLADRMSLESERAQAAMWARENPEFADEVIRALADAGFKPEIFEEFRRAWEAYAAMPDTHPREVFLRGLPGPLQDLWQSVEGQHWFATLLPAESLPVALEAGAISLEHTRRLEAVMSKYRASAFYLSLKGFCAMGILLLFFLGWRRGALVIVIPLIALAMSAGILGWLQQALNLFTVIGFLLAFCLSVDYAIFSTWQNSHDSAARMSVRLSALTTTASFLVLSFSRIQAVASLGLAVAVTVVIALLICEWLALRSRSWNDV